MIEVRRGQLSDFPEISAIQKASPEAAQWPVLDYLQYDLWVAFGDSGVIGFLVARAVAEGEREILNLAVAPESRRRGVARALLGGFLKGYSGAVYLEVRRSNAAALEFYKSMKFNVVSVREDYYDSPPDAAIVMKFHSC